MNYRIEITYKHCQPPVQFHETDEEFEKRVKLWEDDLQFKRFWRLIMVDGDGITPHHFAMESALFLRSEKGAPQLQEIVQNAAIALAHRQSSKKNELLTVGK